MRDLLKNVSVRARQIVGAEFVKFLLVGVGNVVLTFTVYELLLFTTNYMTAFGISAITGLVYTTLMTIVVTFRRELTARSIGAQATWYVAYSVIFALALRAAVDYLRLPPALAPFPLLVMLTPLNFFCARWLMKSSRDLKNILALQGILFKGGRSNRLQQAKSVGSKKPKERKKKASELDRLLWGAHTQYVVRELEAVKDESPSASERSAAAWALARWHASTGNHDCVAENLKLARQQHTDQTWNLRHRLLEIAALTEIGCAHEAKKALQDAVRCLGEAPEICLVAAKVVDICASPSDDRIVIDRQRLAWINKPFSAAGLATLEFANSSLPLSFNNLTTSPVRKHVDARVAKLSVIVPAYNAAETLPAALKSILTQSWDNLEVLVVDDASSDDTWRIIESFAAADGRLKPLRHPVNLGAYGARNTGLRHASGEFVTVHDSDDWSHPEKFSVQVDHLLTTGKPLNTTMWVRMHPNLAAHIRYMNSACIYRNIGSLMARRQDIVAIGGWDQSRVAADDELCDRLRKLHRTDRNTLYSGVPLTLALARKDSLTAGGPTGFVTIKFGARRQYQEAYQYWHELESTKTKPRLVMCQQERPFPIPEICKVKRADKVCCSLLYVADFSELGRNSAFVADIMKMGHRIGLKQAWFHWPKISGTDRPIVEHMRQTFHAKIADCVVAGESIECEVVVFFDPTLLFTVPDFIPNVRAKHCILITPYGSGMQRGKRVAYNLGYEIDHAKAAARSIFGVEPIIAPVSPMFEMASAWLFTEQKRRRWLSVRRPLLLRLLTARGRFWDA